MYEKGTSRVKVASKKTGNSNKRLNLYKYLTDNYHPKEVQVKQNKILYKTSIPFAVDYTKLESAFRERFKEILSKSDPRHQVFLYVEPDSLVTVTETTVKTLRVYSRGTIFLNLIKGPREVERIAKSTCLDVVDADLVKHKSKLFRILCNEEGFERFTFIKRNTNTNLEIVEKNVQNIVETRNFRYLEMKRSPLGEGETFRLVYPEKRQLQIKKGKTCTNINVVLRDLLPALEEIQLVFDWLVKSNERMHCVPPRH